MNQSSRANGFVDHPVGKKHYTHAAQRGGQQRIGVIGCQLRGLRIVNPFAFREAK